MKALHRDTKLKLSHNPTGELVKVLYQGIKALRGKGGNASSLLTHEKFFK